MSHYDDCETCGRQDEVMTSCQDTIFCAGCWKDFNEGRWRGIGSKMKTPAEAALDATLHPIFNQIRRETIEDCAVFLDSEECWVAASLLREDFK